MIILTTSSMQETALRCGRSVRKSGATNATATALGARTLPKLGPA